MTGSQRTFLQTGQDSESPGACRKRICSKVSDLAYSRDDSRVTHNVVPHLALALVLALDADNEMRKRGKTRKRPVVLEHSTAIILDLGKTLKIGCSIPDSASGVRTLMAAWRVSNAPTCESHVSIWRNKIWTTGEYPPRRMNEWTPAKFHADEFSRMSRTAAPMLGIVELLWSQIRQRGRPSLVFLSRIPSVVMQTRKEATVTISSKHGSLCTK